LGIVIQHSIMHKGNIMRENYFPSVNDPVRLKTGMDVSGIDCVLIIPITVLLVCATCALLRV